MELKRSKRLPNFTAYLPNHIDPEALDLLKMMLRLNPLERITAKAALEHPFFQLKEWTAITKIKEKQRKVEEKKQMRK